MNVQCIQHSISSYAAEALSEKLGSDVFVGKVDLGLLNRVVINDVIINDRSGNEMLQVSRLSAKFDMLPLLRGKISISVAQLFGFSVFLERETQDSPLNCEFVFDAFSSKDTIKKDLDLDLRVNSLLIRRGKLSYHVGSFDSIVSKFDPQHLELHNIKADISIKALNKDSTNFSLKKFGFEEMISGFALKNMNVKLAANAKQAKVEQFTLELPYTSLRLDTITLCYDGIQTFEEFKTKVRIAVHTLPSYIAWGDLAPFVPWLANMNDTMRMDFVTDGTLDDMRLDSLLITSEDKRFVLSANVNIQHALIPGKAYICGSLNELLINGNDSDRIVNGLFNHKICSYIQSLGDIHCMGEICGKIDDMIATCSVNTDLGHIESALSISFDQSGALRYKGSINTEQFELGRLLRNENLGAVTCSVGLQNSDGLGLSTGVELDGIVSSLVYNDYTYGDICFKGTCGQDVYSGMISLDDPNGYVYLQGMARINGSNPLYDIYARVDHFNPNTLRLTTKYEEERFSGNIQVNFQGNSIDEFTGYINIDSLSIDTPVRQYFAQNINLTSSLNNDKHFVKFTSDFISATIQGKFNFADLKEGMSNLLSNYLPSVIPAKNTMNGLTMCTINADIYNTELFAHLLDIPISVYTHSTLKGYYNETLRCFRLEGYFPRFRYKDKYMESGMVICENTDDKVNAKVRFTSIDEDGAVNMSLHSYAQNDSLSTSLYWGNNTTTTYSGNLATVARFNHNGDNSTIKTVIDVKPTNIVINDTLWEVHKSKIVVDSGKVWIDNLYFNHEERFIKVNGTLSRNLTDTVKIDLNDINLSYVFDIIGISNSVDFGGDATGYMHACNMFSDPYVHSKLFVSNYSINDKRLGNLDITGWWDNDQKGIQLDAYIYDTSPYPTHVLGLVCPFKPYSSLDIEINANHLDVQFISYYIESIATDFKGRATGKVHLYGKFKELNLVGALYTDASMRFDVLDTRFAIKDTLYMTTEGMFFKNTRIADMENHFGTMDGALRYEHFRNFNYNFDIKTDNMLVMNLRESSESEFYGLIYATGTAFLSGNSTQGLEVQAAMTTNKNTIFTYINGSVSSATSNEFIQFVDKTPRRMIQDSVQVYSYMDFLKQEEREAEDDRESDIRLNLLVDITPDATIQIVMDPVAGDYISSKCTGNLRFDFYNKGDLRMFGNLQISQGVYKFSLQDVIRKDFIIENGSEITFNGTPLEANLNIQAHYTVNSVSLNDLIPDASSIVQQPNVRVNCIMNLNGILTRPTFKLGIELPNEKDEIKTLVQNYISTDEQMNMQILYLLAIGKFYTEDSQYSSGNQNNRMLSSVLSSTLSGQLNSALSQVFDTNNWNFGTNLSTGDEGWTDMEVEGVLSAQLLNNRLLFNGNFGYRDNPLANTNFVGDFEAEWLVNKSGNIRLKAYSETNDRYYTKTNLTTQGVGVLLKKDFDKWYELFFWRKWLAHKKKQSGTSAKESVL